MYCLSTTRKIYKLEYIDNDIHMFIFKACNKDFPVYEHNPFYWNSRLILIECEDSERLLLRSDEECIGYYITRNKMYKVIETENVIDVQVFTYPIDELMVKYQNIYSWRTRYNLRKITVEDILRLNI